jgi:hypothetical protein
MAAPNRHSRGRKEPSSSFVDDRPRSSVDLTGASTKVTINGVAGTSSVRVEGFASGTLAAARTVAV